MRVSFLPIVEPGELWPSNKVYGLILKSTGKLNEYERIGRYASTGKESLIKYFTRPTYPSVSPDDAKASSGEVISGLAQKIEFPLVEEPDWSSTTFAQICNVMDAVNDIDYEKCWVESTITLV